MTLSICAIASEVTPLAKTGGLADVAGALTRILHDGGHDARLFMPLYSQIDQRDLVLHPVAALRAVPVTLGQHRYLFDVYTARLPGSRAVVTPVSPREPTDATPAASAPRADGSSSR